LAFDPDLEAWQPAAPTPIAGCEARPEPLVLDPNPILAFGWCGDDAIYDAEPDRWNAVDLAARDHARYAVWTGHEVLAWGDTCCYGTGGQPFIVEAWRFTPSSVSDTG
jgi:hypothetical protein